MSDPSSVRDQLRPFLDSIKDAGTSNDSGTGFGAADIHVTIDGIEFIIIVKRAGNVEDFSSHRPIGQAAGVYPQVEPSPIALTEDHVASLERGIRAEGYTIKVDTEIGDVKLYREPAFEEMDVGPEDDVFAESAVILGDDGKRYRLDADGFTPLKQDSE